MLKRGERTVTASRSGRQGAPLDVVVGGGPAGSSPAADAAGRTVSSVADKTLPVGDAAGFFDPFTGEGIAMALRAAPGEIHSARFVGRLLRA